MSKEFVIEHDCGNSATLSSRCQTWTIMKEDGENLTEGDLEFLANIEAVLNANSRVLLPADHEVNE